MNKRTLLYTALFALTATVVVWAQQPVTVTTSALPSGASTAANQSTIITSLQLLDDTVYTEAATDTTITGIAIMWEDASDTLRAVSSTKPLPVGGDLLTSIDSTLQSIELNMAEEAVDDQGSPTSGTLIFGRADNASVDSVDEDDAGALRMSANRVLYNIIRDADGNERGANVTANNELLVELGAGSASIGTLGANSGVDIGDVTLTAGSNLIGRVQLDAQAANGADGFRYTSAGSTEDEHAVKTSAGVLYSILVTNTNASPRYLRCENDTAANTAPGSETPELDLAIPGNTGGAGFSATFPMGFTFSTALTCWLVTGAADTDVAEVAANEIKVFYTYK